MMNMLEILHCNVFFVFFSPMFKSFSIYYLPTDSLILGQPQDELKGEFNPLSDPPSIYSTKKDKNILFLDFLT